MSTPPNAATVSERKSKVNMVYVYPKMKVTIEHTRYRDPMIRLVLSVTLNASKTRRLVARAGSRKNASLDECINPTS